MTSRTRTGTAMNAFARDTSAVLVVWLAALVLENVVLHVAFARAFAGTWELALLRKVVTPMAFGLAFPLAALVVACGRAVILAASSRTTRVAVSTSAAAVLGALGWGLTGGRHFAVPSVRFGTVTAFALTGAAVTFAVLPKVVRVAERSPRRTAIVGAVVAAIAVVVDRNVLVRLYPAFHDATFLAGVAALACVAFPVVRSDASASGPRSPVLHGIPMFLSALSLAAFGWGARTVRGSDNLRLVVVEHGVGLARTLVVAAHVAPPPPMDEETPDAGRGTPVAGASADATATPARALDWTGHDVVLVTIDALRADHVSSYGYGRATTPAIDALASEGTRFTHAYCSTPHTSYSVTSMLTGKYARPLLLLGMGADSETWASYARTYGYRTAAFYPPAVFFIDAPRFATFERRGLDFEYRKVEFASPKERAAQVDAYLASGGPSPKPLFLWVHLFEPHEPYVMHPEHPFGDAAHPTDVDAYDSEIRAADEGVADIVGKVRARRPGAVVFVTADHGEEFGEHGGRYHGTTVHEEQVRVPLVVVGPGVARGVVDTVVQTIDLLPTTLSALGVPRPPRIRGRDLGELLVRRPGTSTDPGLAFAETEDFTLVARGDARLVCQRKIRACSLERTLHEVGGREVTATDDRPGAAATITELRAVSASLARDHGKFERGDVFELPDALRRGMMRDADVAEDVAALLDDARVDVRRRAAEVSFLLHAPAAGAAVKRAFLRDEDPRVRRWCLAARIRIDGVTPDVAPDAIALGLGPEDPDTAFATALALAEHGDRRGERVLVDTASAAMDTWLREDVERAREALAAIGTLRSEAAVPLLVRALGDVRVRTDVADALGALGPAAASARPQLAATFADERYHHARPHEAKALLAMGARRELGPSLKRFAGVVEPMADVVRFAREAGLLEPRSGGLAVALDGASDAGLRSEVVANLAVPVDGGAETHPLRVLVEVASAAGSTPEVSVDGAGPLIRAEGFLFGTFPTPSSASARVVVRSSSPVRAVWLVREADEIPPPAPRAWDAGADSEGGTDPDAGAGDSGQRR
ncbi:MAG: sulfatase-like hydrolase/transferase [Polyangiaceae bacterium]